MLLDQSTSDVDAEALGRIYLPGRVSIAAAVASGLLLATIKLSLAASGFGKTLERASAMTRRRSVKHLNETDTIDWASQAVATAAALYPGRALCLEQSLALYCQLRWAGVRVELRLGVQPYPFEAHSWVEHREVPIYEDPENLRRFVPLPDLSQ